MLAEAAKTIHHAKEQKREEQLAFSFWQQAVELGRQRAEIDRDLRLEERDQALQRRQLSF